METDGAVYLDDHVVLCQFVNGRKDVAATEKKPVDLAGMSAGRGCGVADFFAQIVGAGLCFPPDRHGGSWRDEGGHMKKDCPEYAEIRKDGNHLYTVNIPHYPSAKNTVSPCII